MLFTSSKNLFTETLAVRKLGRADYESVWQLQHELVAARAENCIPDTLLCVEHEPVITLGRKSPEYRAMEASGQKELAGVPLFVVERGGEATYHGPGQLVAYPIFRLSERLGARGFLQFLESVLVELLSHYGLTAYTKEGATGIWLRDHKGRERKLASLGIAVRNSVSYHGLALNVTTDLSYFRKIKPCGFSGDIMTSLAELLLEVPTLEQLENELAKVLERRSSEWRT